MFPGLRQAMYPGTESPARSGGVETSRRGGRCISKRFVQEFIERDQRSANREVRSSDKQERSDERNDLVTTGQSETTRKVRECAEPPYREEQVEHSKEERPRCNQDDEESCGAASGECEQGANSEGEWERSEEKSVASIPAPPVGLIQGRGA